MVKVEAKVCKHCGNDIEPYVAEVDPNALTPVQQTIGGFAVLGIIFYAITNKNTRTPNAERVVVTYRTTWNAARAIRVKRITT